MIKQGVGAAAIHGNKSQSARVAALESFKAGRIKALVATDIAARGIDISELTHVFQLDLPEVPKPMCTASAAPAAPGPRARP